MIMTKAMTESVVPTDKELLDLGHECELDAVAFGRAVESEVRKQDEALILMLVERLERADKISGYPNNRAAIKAGRTRLEGKYSK